MKHYFLDIFLVILMFLSVNALQTYFHESIHSDICENSGGSAEIKYSFLMQGGKTECTTHENDKYHLVNDLVSYSVSVLVITLFMGFVFLAIIFEKKKLFDKNFYAKQEHRSDIFKENLKKTYSKAQK